MRHHLGIKIGLNRRKMTCRKSRENRYKQNLQKMTKSKPSDLQKMSYLLREGTFFNNFETLQNNENEVRNGGQNGFQIDQNRVWRRFKNRAQKWYSNKPENDANQSKRPSAAGKLGAKKRFPFETALGTLSGLILAPFWLRFWWIVMVLLVHVCWFFVILG